MKNSVKVGIVFVIIVLLGVGFYFGFDELSTFGGGTVLSINEVEFGSNVQGIRGDAFLVTFAQTSLGQHIYGTFNSNEINSRISGNERVETGFRMDIRGSETVCNYDINRQSSDPDYIYKVSLIDEGRCDPINPFGATCQDRVNQCDGIGFWVKYTWQLRGHYVCMGETQFTPVGNIQFSREDFSADISVTVDGQTHSTTINNRDGGVNILDGKIVVDWVGNLGTGQQCPSPAQQNVMAAYLNNQWRIIDSSKFQTWSTLTSRTSDNIPRNLEDCIRAGWQDRDSGADIANKCIPDFNRLVDDTLVRKDFRSVGGSNAITLGSSNDGRVTINTGRQLSFPVFTMRIQADMLGVYVPVAEPKIQNVVCDDITSGFMGIARVDVRNTGNTGGGARVSVNCNSPLTVSTGALNGFLEPGVTNSFNFALTGDGSGSVSCTAQVREAGTNTITDTETFTCNLKEVGADDPETGDRRCTMDGEYQIYGGGRWNTQSPVPHPNCEGGIIEDKTEIDWVFISFLIIGGLGIAVAIFIRLQREGYFD